MFERHGRSRSSLLERNDCSCRAVGPARADRISRQQLAGAREVPRQRFQQRDRWLEHSDWHSPRLRTERRPHTDPAFLSRRCRSSGKGRASRGRSNEKENGLAAAVTGSRG